MGERIDREKFHQTLFERTDRNDTLRLNQKEMAKELGISQYTVCRLCRDFKGQGRIRQVGSSKNSVPVYLVKDPAVWIAERNGTPVDDLERTRKRVIQWS